MRTFLAAGCALLSGCATIFGGGHQRISITSDPSGAMAEVKDADGRVIIATQTPVQATLETGKTYFVPQHYYVELSMPGYETRHAEISPTLNPWYICNILLGGAVGMLIVDPATGAMYRLSHPNLDVTLLRLHGPAGAPLTNARASGKDELEALDQQLFDGVITNEDYARKRAQILDRSMQ